MIKKLRNICVYCGLKADTKDHIPTKNLFQSTSGISFITVPSCRKCNSGFQKDEEFFRQLLASILYKQSPVASFLLHNPIARSMKRKPALGMQMFKQMNLVDHYSKGRIYLGKKTAIHITKKDHQRIFNVLDKYIKGLYYHHFNKMIPDGWAVKHHWLMEKFEEKVVDTLKDMRWERVKEDTFVYGFSSVPKTHQSIWCLIFFGQPLFYTFVIDKKNAEKFEKKSLKK